MAYKSLYRKYRPQTFKEVYGQEYIVKTLCNAIESGKISHAYLFNGTRGTGKTTIAKIFAKTVNCLDMKDNKSCGKCLVCKCENTPCGNPSSFSLSRKVLRANERKYGHLLW